MLSVQAKSAKKIKNGGILRYSVADFERLFLFNAAFNQEGLKSKIVHKVTIDLLWIVPQDLYTFDWLY